MNAIRIWTVHGSFFLIVRSVVDGRGRLSALDPGSKGEEKSMLNIGVFIDGFRKPVLEGLELAAKLGCRSFQVYITKGPMLASAMDKSARAEFVSRYRDLGLTLSATCGDFGLHFGKPDLMKEKEPLLKDAILQTVDLQASIMTTHIGSIGEDPDGRVRETMVDNLKRLGDFAADHGVTLATETGLESGPSLRSLLEEAGSKGIGVNFDPANLVMNGFDHMKAANVLSPFIVHTHAKDGVRQGDHGKEVPLGEGDVNFPAYIALMKELGYKGAYTIEREVGDDPVGDIKRAIEYLRQF